MVAPPSSLAGTADYLQNIRERVGCIVVGQDVVVERTLIALLPVLLYFFASPFNPGKAKP